MLVVTMFSIALILDLFQLCFVAAYSWAFVWLLGKGLTVSLFSVRVLFCGGCVCFLFVAGCKECASETLSVLKKQSEL